MWVGIRMESESPMWSVGQDVPTEMEQALVMACGCRTFRERGLGTHGLLYLILSFISFL